MTVNTLEVQRFEVGDIVYLTGVVMTSGTTSVCNSTFYVRRTLRNEAESNRVA